MEKLKLYTVDEQYVRYLRGFDARVMFWNCPHYKKQRKYLGVVLKINGFEYFAPLSSPKETDYIYIKGEKRVRKNTVSIIRLVSDKGRLLGKVKLSNMIPVQPEFVELYDLIAETDRKYANLVQDEMICIRKCKSEILRNAQILYNQKVKGYSGIGYLNSNVDFKRLEQACLAF